MKDKYKILAQIHAKLLSAIADYDVEDLMEFNVESQIGYDLATFFAVLAKIALHKNFLVNAEEISDGKYRIHFNPEAEISYILYCKGKFNPDDVAQSLMDSLVIPYLNNSEQDIKAIS